VTKQLVPISIEEFKRLIGIDSNSKLLVSESENSLVPIENAKSTSDSQTVADSSTSEIIHYQQLNPYIEAHQCEKCQAVRAEIKLTSNKGTRQPHYTCENCYHEYRFEHEPQGVKFVEDQPELPPYLEEPMEVSA
jgi:DNA-directed RNA polymerase subunit M/transcription elongation factor TFIIS